MKSLAALTVLLPTLAFADPKGMEWLGKVDHMMNNFNDGVFESKLLVKTPDETPEPRNRRVDITVR